MGSKNPAFAASGMAVKRPMTRRTPTTLTRCFDLAKAEADCTSRAKNWLISERSLLVFSCLIITRNDAFRQEWFSRENAADPALATRGHRKWKQTILFELVENCRWLCVRFVSS